MIYHDFDFSLLKCLVLFEQHLYKIHEKKNPNNHTRLSVSYENSLSIYNNSCTLCFWLYKYAAVHYIKPYIIWKCLFCRLPEVRCSPEGQLCLRRMVLLFLLTESRLTDILKPFQDHDEYDQWNQIHALGLLSCSSCLQTHQKPMKTSAFPLFLSDTVTSVIKMSPSSHQIHSLKTHQNHVDQKSPAAGTAEYPAQVLLSNNSIIRFPRRHNLIRIIQSTVAGYNISWLTDCNTTNYFIAVTPGASKESLSNIIKQYVFCHPLLKTLYG